MPELDPIEALAEYLNMDPAAVRRLAVVTNLSDGCKQVDYLGRRYIIQQNGKVEYQTNTGASSGLRHQ